MRVELKMPDLATTESEIRITRWLVEEGQAVCRGQETLEVETDKAVMAVESYADGVLAEILVEAGDAVEVGQAIAILECETASETVEMPAPPAAAPAVTTLASPVAPPKRQGMFARNRQAASAVVVPPMDEVAIPLGIAARTAARRLQESKQTVPHFYLQASVNAEPMVSRRNATEPNPAWDAFFVYAIHRALQDFPRFRYRLEEEQLVPQGTDSIGVAVDLDGDLYVVPIVPLSTPEQISDSIRLSVDRLRSDPQARKMQRSLITVTNLGMTGIEAFTAIINPPEAAILAIGRIAPAVVVEHDVPVVQNRVTLNLSVDHRVVSGKYAAEFLMRIVRELESLAQN